MVNWCGCSGKWRSQNRILLRVNWEIQIFWLSITLFQHKNIYRNHTHRQSSKEVYELNDATVLLKHPKFDVNRKIVLYIHGFIESPESPTVQKIIDVYRKRQDYNILVLDWKALAAGLYPTAVRKSSEVSFGCFSFLFDVWNIAAKRRV